MNLPKYLETIAKESIYIKHSDADTHFSIASGVAEIEGLLQNSASAIGVQLIAIDDISGNFDNNDDVNLYDTEHHSFLLLQHVNYQNITQRYNSLKSSKNIIRKIIKRMAKDQYELMKMPPASDTIGIRNFNQNSVKYFTAGPFADNWIGLQVSFTCGEQCTEAYNPDEWSYNIE